MSAESTETTKIFCGFYALCGPGLKFDFRDLFEGEIERGRFVEVRVPVIQVARAGAAVAEGAVGAVGAPLFVGSEGEREGTEGLSVVLTRNFGDQGREVFVIGAVLGGGIGKMIGLVRVFGEPVDHFHLFGLKGRAAVQVCACRDEEVTVNAGLQAVEQGVAPGAFCTGLGGFPIHNYGSTRGHREEVVLCQDT